jgi:hypothetical protein
MCSERSDFFARTARSATVRTLRKNHPCQDALRPLRQLKERHICLRQILESIYSERILKKVVEDLKDEGPYNPLLKS